MKYGRDYQLDQEITERFKSERRPALTVDGEDPWDDYNDIMNDYDPWDED